MRKGQNIRGGGYTKDAVLGALIIAAGILTTAYSNIWNVYGGGGKLFGGYYIICFYAGMMLAKYHIFDKVPFKKSCLFTVISGICFLLVWYGRCRGYWTRIDDLLPWEKGQLKISTLLQTFSALGGCFGLFTLLENGKYPALLTDAAAWLGRHTLYIFLYHRLFLDFVLERYLSELETGFVKTVIYFTGMILGPILIETLISYIKKVYRTLETDEQREC